LRRTIGIVYNQTNITINLFTYHSYLELHTICCESSSFVCENVLNLTELFVQ
jgi:hypothetical protein